MNSVQALIDGLAERVGQPVGIDDCRFRSVAYSSHADEIDPVRRMSILGRQAPEQVADWLEHLGIARAVGYVRVPGNPELSMVPRVCFPLRFHERLLGYLWLTEHHGPVSDALLVETERYAREIAEDLYRLDQEERAHAHQEADAVRMLTERMNDGSMPRPTPLAAAARYAVAVLDTAAGDAPLGPEAEVRLTAATARARRSWAPRHLLAMVAGGEAVVVLAGSSADELERMAAGLLGCAEVELADLEPATVMLGLGGPRARLNDLPDSRHEAKLAVRVARAATTYGPLANWPRLEAYQLVAQLLDGRDAGDFVPNVLRELLMDQDAETLVSTVEAYLEHGGDAAGAAAELFIHRSSLYNRLHRVEELTGVDMQSGSDRLQLHLGLRLWRLSGLATDVETPGQDPTTAEPGGLTAP